jgi:mRNA interferase RelE/StbE
MYRLLLDRGILKELGDVKRYPAKVYRQITQRILELPLDPRPPDSEQVGTGYRVDVGEYRIYYEISEREQLITVWVVGRRNDDEIYKRLKRKLGQ